MSYSQRLYPWAIIRLLPQAMQRGLGGFPHSLLHQDMQRMVVRRFRNRSDAEGHLQALKRLMPDQKFIIIFDLPDPMEGESTDDESTDKES
ncbi:hypothetical protein BJP36_15265 [Moorena producens JHB]|uniref:Uncharacterized protein n=1 Tax=Moorena producens (strain JHB) TaxID=1454205 RepID=A0A1D9G0V9_MOOP1|nr:hypothetical protein [Moorena producens]AOY81060.1 hypothetical protein BJP36_15265 [Moorena producens JHB]